MTSNTIVQLESACYCKRITLAHAFQARLIARYDLLTNETENIDFIALLMIFLHRIIAFNILAYLCNLSTNLYFFNFTHNEAHLAFKKYSPL